MTLIDRIEAIYAEHGSGAYEGARKELVTALEHALQCAQLAEWAHADAPLVAAALLHDIGHFIAVDPDAVDVDDVHELRAVPFLAQGFGPSVTEPVRLHVPAKRYLVAVDAGYAATLSPASVHTLKLQGGAMTLEERLAFEALPFARQAVQLRRWDDLAKTPGVQTPALGYYLALLEELGMSSALGSSVPSGH